MSMDLIRRTFLRARTLRWLQPLLLLFAIALPVSVSGAAGPSAEKAPEAAEGVVEKPAANAADQEKRPAKEGEPSSDVFIPSEDISEDFAVAFPVDI